MKQIKRMYNNYALGCDQFINCAECAQMYINGGCRWFENDSILEYYMDGKLPKIGYEYCDDHN